MQKYFLLVFNEDWADEHNVPAQACFTEAQYDKWLESPLARVNPKYEEQKASFDIAVAAQNKYDDLLRANYNKKGSVPQSEINAARVPYVNSIHDKPKKAFSYISARLGNNGQDFGESFADLLTGEDFVKDGVVQAYEVPKEFFEVFKEVELSDLSLCNIFDDNISDYYDE